MKLDGVREGDAVFAYEDAALRTFQAAKRKNIATVYELPLGYYEGVAREINRARTAPFQA